MLSTTRQRSNKPLSISTTPTYMMQMGDIAFNSQGRLPHLLWELLVPLLRNAFFKTNDLSSVRDAGTPLLSVCPSMTTWDMLRRFHISTCRKTAPKPSTYQWTVCQSFSMLPPKHQQASCSMTSSCWDLPSILISPRSSTSFDFTVWACLRTSPKCSAR